MIRIKSVIRSNRRLSESCYRITLEVPDLITELRPGQFINMKIGEANDPLFRRPFSVFRVTDLGGGVSGIEVVYKIVGRGTRLLADLNEGEELDIIGPLGRGFQFLRHKRTQILLAGGIGAASLFMLGEEISKSVRECGFDLYSLLGAQSKENLVLEDEFATLNGEVLVSTDDGTTGY